MNLRIVGFLFLSGLAGIAGACGAYAQVGLGDAVPLPGDELIGAAAGDQERPTLSLGNGQYLAVWRDYRSAREKLVLDQGGSDIHAARIALDGTVVDSVPIPITNAAADQDTPRVAWNGSDWLVTWESQEPTQFYYATSILGVRVSAAGQVLDAAPIVIFQYSNSGGATHAVVGGGGQWIAVAQGTSGGEEQIVARRISGSGQILDPVAKTLHVPPSLALRIDLAESQGNYLMAWNESGGVRCMAIDAQLNKLTPNPVAVNNSVIGVSDVGVAGSPNGWFVTFAVYSSGTQWGTVYGARVSAAGQVQDPGGIAIQSDYLLSQPYLRSVFDGTNWIVVWAPNSFLSNLGLLCARVTPAGQVFDTNGVAVAASTQAEFREVWAAPRPGGGLRVVWADPRAGGLFPFDVYTQGIDGSLQALPETVVSRGAPRQRVPDVVWNGVDHLVVFRSEVSGAQRILAQRLDAFGHAIDLEPVEWVAPAVALGPPRVDWNGVSYLLAWEQGGKAWVRRFGEDLAPQDPAPNQVMEVNTSDVDVASLDGTFLVVGVDNPISEHFQQPFVRRVGANGAFLDAARTVIGGSHARVPRIAAFGDRWLVVWQQNSTHDNPNASIQGRMVAADGTLPAAQFAVTNANGAVRAPFPSFSGSGALVTWGDPRGGGDLYGRMLDAAGAPIGAAGGFPVVAGNGEQQAGVVAWNGARYVALAPDLRDITFFIDERTDVYGARVDAGGAVLDAAPFAAFDDPLSEMEPAIAGALGSSLAVAAVFEPAAPYGAYRITTRPIEPCAGTALAVGAGCAGSGGFVPRLALTGCPASSGNGFLVVQDALGGSFGILLFGGGPAVLPLPGGCLLNVGPLLPPSVPLPLTSGGPGQGELIAPFALPPNLPMATVGLQLLVADPGVPQGYASTQGLLVHLN